MASPAKEYMTPGFLDRTTRPMTLAALPPHAEFIKNQAVMTAEMVKEAAALEDGANRAIATVLHEKGYKVRVIGLQEIDGTPGLKDLVHRIDTRYDEEWTKAMRKPKEARKGRYSIGEDAVAACSLLHVDGLVMSRIVAVGNSGGRQAITIILSLGQAYAQSYARISLSVIEGKAGRVEGHFSGLKYTTTGGLIKKPDKVMADLVGNAIDDYPEASEIKVAKKAPPQAEAATDTSPESDEAAISDFEAALEQKNARTAPPGAEPPGAEPPAAGSEPAPPPQPQEPAPESPPPGEPEPAPPPADEPPPEPPSPDQPEPVPPPPDEPTPLPPPPAEPPP
jgi:hypothetical protein